MYCILKGFSLYNFGSKFVFIVIVIVIISNRTAYLYYHGAPDTKFMWPTWGPPGFCRPQVGPKLVPRTLLSGSFLILSNQPSPRWTLLSGMMAADVFVPYMYKSIGKRRADLTATPVLWITLHNADIMVPFVRISFYLYRPLLLIAKHVNISITVNTPQMDILWCP